MESEIDFEVILEIFESHGWRLERIWMPYRVFMKEGHLPWLIPVHEGKVDYEYVKKIKTYFEGQAGKTSE